ncbi:hypothetical protein BOTNAR_0494g00020 [Botryotinia narcissicola]|uniref:Uncharacterized protein n=1 Tax=Botryotinia narcissicola TaxID=278944 RepID=A0A4Z1HLC2_9HELO|nr:hypothetical protein BOTNAR_0494g00020 [Botryotinia narcissicola]
MTLEETEVIVDRTELEGSAHVARRMEKMHVESGNVAVQALGHNGSALDQLGTNVTLEPQTIALKTDKETWKISHDWRGLPLHATLIESSRVTKDMRPPTPTQVAIIHSFVFPRRNIFIQAPLEKNFGYVVSALKEVLLAHNEKNKFDDLSSAVLKPTILVILPTNAMATQLRAFLTTLVLDEANVLVENRSDWSELTSQEGIIEAIGSMSVRRILVATTRSSEHTDAVLEIVYKARQKGAGIKNFLVFLDTREETEWLGKLFEYNGDVTLPFNSTNLEGKKLGKKLYDELYYSYTSMSRRNESVYSKIHDVLADETRTSPVVCGTTDIMRDGMDAPFDVVLQFLKRPSRYKDCTHEKIMETWYSRAGTVRRYERTAISYTYLRPGVDDHAASEFIKIEEQQGDVPMQFLLDAKARHEKQKGTVEGVEGGESSSKSSSKS